jgi:hypothetical protein
MELQTEKSLRPAMPQVPVSPKKPETFVLREVDEDLIDQILEIEEKLSKKLKYSKQDIIDSIRSPDEMLIVSAIEGELLGYVVAIPQNDAVKELQDEDLLLERDEKRFYVDRGCVSFAISEKAPIFFRLFNKLFYEAEKKGIFRFSSHIRTSNGVNLLVRTMLKDMVTSVRENVFLPRHGDETFEYVEFDRSKK